MRTRAEAAVDEEIEDFVARHGLPAEAAGELRRLLRGARATLVPSESAAATIADGLGFDDATADGDPVPPVDDRYEDLGLLGTGGMSEVRRVRDVRLRRALAMKIADPARARHPSALARFVDEAQTTAQLDHPGVVPVHELGRTADGRLYFTMKEVRGRTLREVLADVHRSSPAGAWGETTDGWNLHRLLDAWRRVCETVAHAHARGVIHRDLKPDNVMVGAYGEVLVLDWGLARSGAGAEREAELEPVVTDRSGDDTLRTRAGMVAGTPMYMSPEQARGELHHLDARSDVYALGIVLYELLYGEPPYDSGSVAELLDQVSEARVSPPEAPPRPVPAELVELWRDCTEPERGARPADASILATRVRRWQEGAERRERALAVVAEAARVLPEVERLRQRARSSRDEATRLASGVAPWEPVERKRELWALEDEAAELERRAELEELRATELLRAALTQAPDLAEARERLANLYRRRFAEVEARGDAQAAARYEVLLRAHDDGRHAAWLRGEGTLTLLTDPSGAEVELLRYEVRDRRLVPAPFLALRTPLRAHPLPMGSYLAVLRAPGRAEVRYPIRIDRRGHWDGVAPGTSAPFPIRLPAAEELGPDDVHVAAGWFQAGGEPRALQAWPSSEEWVDAFVIRRFQVTNAEYLAFLDDLVRRGRSDEALRHAPREPRPGGRLGEPVYGRRPDGGFELRPDAQGDRWEPDWPVVLVDRAGAEAYAAWVAERTGLPWRLPTEREWEKAARGVDGREFPWGAFHDPTWTNMRASRPGRHFPAPVTDFPGDESPYGARGMAGNVRTWCAGPFEAGSPDGAVRGGAWSFSEEVSRCCARSRVSPDRRTQQIGVRLARSA